MKKYNKRLPVIGRVGNKDIEVTNALTLIYDSKEYFDYYKRGKLNKNDYSKPGYFLLMRSLELALKATLKIKEGISVEDLKIKYGHNVEKLYDYCVSRDYVKTVCRKEKNAIKILSKYYQEKEFEYTQLGLKSIPFSIYISDLIETIYFEFNAICQNTKIQKYL